MASLVFSCYIKPCFELVPIDYHLVYMNAERSRTCVGASALLGPFRYVVGS